MEGRGTCRGDCTCKIYSPISHVCHKRVLLNLGLLLDFQGTVSVTRFSFHLHLVRRLQSCFSEVKFIHYPWPCVLHKQTYESHTEVWLTYNCLSRQTNPLGGLSHPSSGDSAVSLFSSGLNAGYLSTKLYPQIVEVSPLALFPTAQIS